MERDLFREMKSYVGWTDEDSTRLAAVVPPGPVIAEVVDHFYRVVQQHEGTRRLMSDPALIARLKGTLADWLVTLFSGPHDRAYYEKRCRIGRRHVQIGLDQHYMFTAMAIIREDLATYLAGGPAGDTTGRPKALAALHKILDLELAIMLETYREERFEFETLRESERKYRDLIENAPEIILTVDREGRIRHINRTALDLLGYPPEEPPVRFLDLVPAEKVREAWSALAAAFDGNPGGQFETEFVSCDGVRRLVAVRVSGLVPSARGPETVRAFVRDVTEERRLQAEMAEYRRQAEEKRRLAAIGQMVAGIAHEIRTPLQVITAGFDSLAGLAKTPELERETVRARRGIQQIRGFIQEILDYSKEIRLCLMEVEPSSLVGSALADLEEEIRTAGVKIECGPFEKGVRVIADPFRMKQVLVNVLRNAVEATPPGGWIRVSARPAGANQAGVVEFVVVDDGRGIPESDIEKIFVPFFTTKPRGTGLGLPIVQRLVDAHGGTVEVRRLEPKGTMVRIRIPRAPARRRVAVDG
ncbi:MAG: PAS domain S-box protein [Planctomycetes bacterium]|nr:PAS domain S-box protein [Planctomycetota bacterium]